MKDKAQAIVEEIGADKSVAETKLEAAKPALQAAEDALQVDRWSDLPLGVFPPPNMPSYACLFHGTVRAFTLPVVNCMLELAP